jgi:hypothetical protein
MTKAEEERLLEIEALVARNAQAHAAAHQSTMGLLSAAPSQCMTCAELRRLGFAVAPDPKWVVA